MSYYALITTKYEKADPESLIPGEESGKEITWIGDREIPDQPDGQLVAVPRILIPALKASAVEEIIEDKLPELPLSEKENGSIEFDHQPLFLSAIRKVTYNYDAEILLAAANVDYTSFLEDYETSGLEAVLTKSSNVRPLQILTVDVIGLSDDTSRSIYERIIRNLTATLEGLSEEDRSSAVSIIKDLIIKYKLPLEFDSDNKLSLII